MDLLLRRLGRHQETSAPSDHLDADELSSYAENVLPPAARVRYTEHLAECAHCRDLVVQLSSSAGVVAAQETARVPGPSALRKFLASFFSPMVLRYAVPALGLVVVAAIGFMVSRNQSPAGRSVVMQQPASAPAPVPESQAQPSSSTNVESRGLVDREESAAKSVAHGDTASQAAPAPPPNAPPAVSSVAAEVQDAAKKVEQQQEEAKEAAPAPKPTPAATHQLQQVEPLQKQAKAANEPPAEKAKEKVSADAEVAAASPGAARDRAEAFGVAGGVQSARRTIIKRQDAAEKDKNDADTDTRTVAGRRFRKEGSVWIDTAYNSSQSPISVRRGSEQFRALVADEPQLKQIADQLDGEIIVVWKGQPYRIR